MEAKEFTGEEQPPSCKAIRQVNGAERPADRQAGGLQTDRQAAYRQTGRRPADRVLINIFYKHTGF